jgi:Kef-type K+ transport system membrane component KefB/nucleotide-binding universal stress UspA family protein
MENFTAWLAANPIVSFTILLLASLTVPPLIERIRLPGLVGLLLAGTALGPYGLGVLSAETETVKLLSDIGKIYLMFVAGLEIDMVAFRRMRNRSLSFGMATFAIPLIVGTLVGQGFGFGWNASILIGSLLASHTLLAYPIVQRLGVVRNEAVTVTVGATIFTDIGALLVLAVCVAIHQGEFTWFRLPLQLGALGVYSTIVLFGLDWLGKEYFRRTGNDEGNQFLFILLALFLASVGAQAIHIENIVGAFLAGLAVNDVLGRSAVKEKVEFVGGVLFIPFFFIAMGLLINIPVFLKTISNDLGLVIAVVIGLIGSKFLAAFCVKGLYRYSWTETLTMWSLSLPQVAATLAAALVGFQVGLLSEALFNSVIVLMLVTSVLGPVITRRFANQLVQVEQLIPDEGMAEDSLLPASPPGKASEFTVLVPVHNPRTEAYLVEMAGLLAKQQRGKLIPLAIAQSIQGLSEPGFLDNYRRAQQLLDSAVEITASLALPAIPQLRIDRDVALGICHTAYEQEAHLILMGYGDMVTLQARLLGSVVDQVARCSPCPLAIMQLELPPLALKRMVLPIWDLHPSTRHRLWFAQQLTVSLQCSLTIVYICPPATSPAEQTLLRQQLAEEIQGRESSVADVLSQYKLKVIPHTDAATVVLRIVQPTDLIILHMQDVMSSWEARLEDWGTRILHTAKCSVALFSESILD